MAQKTTVASVRDLLGDADFPMEKEAIVQHAASRPHDQPTLKALRALPLGTYENVEEVTRSVDSIEAGR